MDRPIPDSERRADPGRVPVLGRGRGRTVVVIVCLLIGLVLVGVVTVLKLALERRARSRPIRVEDFLPADRGLATAIRDARPVLCVHLAMRDGRLDVSIDGASLPGRADEVDAAVTARVATVVAAHDGTGTPVVAIAAGPDVPNHEVVRMTDAAIAGGALDVAFVGAPPSGVTR